MDPLTCSPACALVGGVLSVIELWGNGQVGNALGKYLDEVNWGCVCVSLFVVLGGYKLLMTKLLEMAGLVWAF